MSNSCNISRAALYRLLMVFIIVMAFCTTVNFAASTQDKVALTAEEKLWLKQHVGKITIAPCPNYPPIDFIDKEGKEAGISADFLALIEKRLNFRFKRVYFKTWAEVQEAGKRGQIYGATSVHRTDERELYWQFSRPYVTYQTVLITNNRIQGQLTLDRLYGLRVAMVENYAISEYMAKNHPDLKLILVPNDRAGIHRVSAGDIDVLIADLPTAAYLIEKEGITNLRIAGETGQFFSLSVATRKDIPILNRIINKALATITQEERSQIFARWVGVRIVRPFDWRMAWIITSLILLVVLTTLIWNVALRKRVRSQTEELTNTNARLRAQIGENARTMDALQESETRFRSMVQNVPGVVYQLRIDEEENKFTYVSPQGMRLFGYQPDEHPDNWMFGQFIHPEDTESFRKVIETAIDNKQPWDYEGRLLLPGGAVRYVHEMASPSFSGGKPVYNGLLLDVTEEKQAEIERRQFYRDTISIVTDGKLSVASRHEVDNYLKDTELTHELNTYEQTVGARQEVMEYAEEHGLSGDDLHLFITGVGEAMTNAIKHAEKGLVSVGTRGSMIWAAVSDQGAGISALTLPKATLKRGHSTMVSMGMGYCIILEASDEVILHTGSEGTTVILIKDPKKPKHTISIDDFPDTW